MDTQTTAELLVMLIPLSMIFLSSLVLIIIKIIIYKSPNSNMGKYLKKKRDKITKSLQNFSEHISNL